MQLHFSKGWMKIDKIETIEAVLYILYKIVIALKDLEVKVKGHRMLSKFQARI